MLLEREKFGKDKRWVLTHWLVSFLSTLAFQIFCEARESYRESQGSVVPRSLWRTSWQVEEVAASFCVTSVDLHEIKAHVFTGTQ